MATTLQTLIDRTRMLMRDNPDYDQLSVSLAASNGGNSTLIVADNTIYVKRWPIEVDYETMMIRSTGGTQSLTATRTWLGAPSASHSVNAPILIRPAFYTRQYIDAINTAIMAMYPYVYQPVVDTSLTVQTNQYQYVIPNVPGYTSYPLPHVWKIEVLQPGDYTFRLTRRYELLRGNVTSGSPSTSGSISSSYPIFKFKSLPPISSTIRVHGFGPFPPLVNLSDTLNTLFPPQAEYLLHKIAAGYMLLSGEAGRDRSDSGPIDRREEANRGGLSLSAGLQILGRTEQELLRNCMPPISHHIQAVI